jgi:hypothetical protein
MPGRGVLPRSFSGVAISCVGGSSPHSASQSRSAVLRRGRVAPRRSSSPATASRRAPHRAHIVLRSPRSHSNGFALISSVLVGEGPPAPHPTRTREGPAAVTGAGPSQFYQSGRRDLNSRPPEPHSGALPGCATSRTPDPRHGRSRTEDGNCSGNAVTGQPGKALAPPAAPRTAASPPSPPAPPPSRPARGGWRTAAAARAPPARSHSPARRDGTP